MNAALNTSFTGCKILILGHPAITAVLLFLPVSMCCILTTDLTQQKQSQGELP
jgi:hypothetical protein